MNSKFRFLEFNLGILAISSSGVLGRYLTINSTVATLWRCIIAVICLFLIVRLLKIEAVIDWSKHRITMIGSSVLLAIHWLTYFYALDYSNVSIGLMTLYTFPAMTAIIEPIWKRERIPLFDISLAMAALFAVYIIAPPFEITDQMKLAVALGLLSAFAYSIRNIWLVDISKEYNGTTVMMYQLVIVTILLSPALYFFPVEIDNSQWAGLIMLGLITTAIGHTLFLRGVSYYNATTASILACIVPVFGITLGYLFLNEVPTTRTMIGGAIIILIVIVKAVKGK